LRRIKFTSVHVFASAPKSPQTSAYAATWRERLYAQTAAGEGFGIDAEGGQTHTFLPHELSFFVFLALQPQHFLKDEQGSVLPDQLLHALPQTALPLGSCATQLQSPVCPAAIACGCDDIIYHFAQDDTVHALLG
jgi:hypothetical protein